MGQYLEIIRQALEEIEAERSRKGSSQGHDTRLDLSGLPGESIIALKVWSHLLGAAVWVVVDNLPAGEWPNDAPVYRRSEVKILTAVGHETLAWVQVSRHLVWAREQAIIPWDWIVDETRPVERDPQWTDMPNYLKAVERSYRRDYWRQQGVRLQVWSEKATVGGILAPVLHEYGVGWCYVHGYGSATRVHETAEESLRDTRQLVIVYVGDWDCSGMHMSEVDLPERLRRYGGQVTLIRIALTQADVDDMDELAFPAKRTDSRYQWFVERYGTKCWELDAMNPNELRDRVEEAIQEYIDWDIWERCELAEAAEKETIRTVVGNMIISGLASKKSSPDTSTP